MYSLHVIKIVYVQCTTTLHLWEIQELIKYSYIPNWVVVVWVVLRLHVWELQDANIFLCFIQIVYFQSSLPFNTKLRYSIHT